MKLLILLLTMSSAHIFAQSFNCTSYGIVDVFVNGEKGKDFNLTLIDLPFTEKKETIDTFKIEKTNQGDKFHFYALQEDWFLKIETTDSKGFIEMDYRGILKQREPIYCDISLTKG